MSRFDRKRNTRVPHKRIWIFSEGEKTELLYFKAKEREIATSLKRRGIKIEIHGIGKNTLSLVEHACEHYNKHGEINDECWVVFDYDDFDHFNEAIDKAKTNGLKVAYSNKAFEYWFILHFEYFTAAKKRSSYESILTNLLKKKTGNKTIKYNKKLNIYPFIKDREKLAIKFAKKQVSHYKYQHSYAKKAPSTTVHLLVEAINTLK